MQSEEQVRAAIKEIEDKLDPEDDNCYLDEGEQAYLQALYWVLNEEEG